MKLHVVDGELLIEADPDVAILELGDVLRDCRDAGIRFRAEALGDRVEVSLPLAREGADPDPVDSPAYIAACFTASTALLDDPDLKALGPGGTLLPDDSGRPSRLGRLVADWQRLRAENLEDAALIVRATGILAERVRDRLGFRDGCDFWPGGQAPRNVFEDLVTDWENRGAEIDRLRAEVAGLRKKLGPWSHPKFQLPALPEVDRAVRAWQTEHPDVEVDIVRDSGGRSYRFEMKYVPRRASCEKGAYDLILGGVDETHLARAVVKQLDAMYGSLAHAGPIPEKEEFE